MRNSLKNQDLHPRPKSRALLAVSLCASLAAFACTTDRNVGNGDPVVTPGLRTSPIGGTSSGTETESVPPPMMSSYNASAAMAVRPRISREEAALLLTEMQPRVKLLGTVAPGASTRGGYVSDMVAQQVQSVPQRLTVNSTIYSGPNAAVISGAGEPVGGVDAAATFLDASGVDVSGSTVTGAAASATVAGSTVSTGSTAVNTGATVTNAGGAVIAPNTAAAATPTGTAVVAPAAFASVRTLSPTAAAVVNPPASVSSSPAIATASSARTAGTSRVTGTAATPASSTTAATAAPQSVSANATVNPVRTVTTNGRVTITNVSSRQQ